MNGSKVTLGCHKNKEMIAHALFYYYHSLAIFGKTIEECSECMAI